MSLEVLERDSLRIEPAREPLGAIIQGLDIDNITEGNAATLNEALHQYGVLFYRPKSGLEITNERLTRLAASLGEIAISPYGKGKLQKEDAHIGVIDSESSIQQGRRYCWHSDLSPEDNPPNVAVLNSVIAPQSGGDTMWASMYAAYDTLSPKYQTFLDGLEALHTTDCMARKMGPGVGKEVFGDGHHGVHPVVQTDPVTGRRLLFINENYTDRLVGLSDIESESVLQMLFKHINTPELHVRWQWQVNDVAIWEQRVTQHRAVANWQGKRVLRRISVNGAR